MSEHKRNEWIFGLSIIGILLIFFCVSTFDFPKKISPTETPWPTLDARTVDLKNSLMNSDDFGGSVKLGNQHDGLPSEEFTAKLDTGKYVGIQRFDDVGKPIRTYTYEIISSYMDNYFPEGYLVVFIYSNANEAKKIYGEGGEDLPHFDSAFFLDGYPDSWAYGRFLRCRIIGVVYLEVISKDNLIYFSRDVSSRMEYLC